VVPSVVLLEVLRSLLFSPESYRVERYYYEVREVVPPYSVRTSCGGWWTTVSW